MGDVLLPIGPGECPCCAMQKQAAARDLGKDPVAMFMLGLQVGHAMASAGISWLCRTCKGRMVALRTEYEAAVPAEDDDDNASPVRP